MSDPKEKLVQQSNELYQRKIKKLPVPQHRFLAAYLQKIDRKDKGTRRVRFSLRYFVRLFDIPAEAATPRKVRKTIDSLIRILDSKPNDSGGYDVFPLFVLAGLSKDEYGTWFIDIEANPYADDVMFGYRKFFQYGVGNISRLKSANQIAMYELMKRWEFRGEADFPVHTLREYLGIGKDEYTGVDGWKNFRKRVLDSCQKALEDNTDIAYDYERGKTGRGGKWLSVKFRIRPNEPKVKQTTFEEISFGDDVDDDTLEMCRLFEERMKEAAE